MRRRLALAMLLGSSMLLAIAACVGDDPIIATTPPAADAAVPPPVATTPIAEAGNPPPPTPTEDATSPADANVPDAGSFCEQRVAPDAASLSFCEDFDDPNRDGGYTVEVLDAGRFNRETSFYFSAPTAVNADSFTSIADDERGGWMHWDVTQPTPIHIINVRMKLRPALDTDPHTLTSGYTDLVKVLVGTDTSVVLRYTYGRNLVGHTGYIGYSLITLKNNPIDGGPDGGDAGDSTGVTIATFNPPENLNWNEMFIEIVTGDADAGGGTMSLMIGTAQIVEPRSAPVFPSNSAFIEVGNHASGVMDAPNAHNIDDVRVDVFR